MLKDKLKSIKNSKSLFEKNPLELVIAKLEVVRNISLKELEENLRDRSASQEMELVDWL